MIDSSAHNSHDELNWLAFRYVSDEMTSVEREEFEVRLLDDLSACEALARITQLSLAARNVLESRSVLAVPALFQTHNRGRWAAVALATSALGLLLAYSLSSETNDDAVAARGSLAQTVSLVSQWNDASDETEEDLSALRDETSESLSDAEQLQVPGWMLAAVSLDQRDSTDDDSPHETNPDEPELQDN